MKYIYAGGSGTEEKLRQIAKGLVKLVDSTWTVMVADFERTQGRSPVEKDVIHSGAGMEPFKGMFERVVSDMLDGKASPIDVKALGMVLVLQTTARGSEGVEFYFNNKLLAKWALKTGDEVKVVGELS